MNAPIKTVVFLGPSLPLATARASLPDAIYLPPCALGDVLAALQRHRPQVIAIIDGLFERTPAVWHKEILYALSQGVSVFGGGSMGALRAAELSPFGMRGVGRTYDSFASGELDDDDEVAITHLSAADGYRAMCEPMVNLRYGLELARQQQLFDAATEQALVAAMKRLHYPDRSWEALLAAARSLDVAEAAVQAFAELVRTRRPDRKAEDAVAVLQAVHAFQQGHACGTPVHLPEFEPTVFWEHLLAYLGQMDAAGHAVPYERMIDHVRFGIAARTQVLDEALLGVLARQVGDRPVDDVVAMRRFRRERGLEKSVTLSQWMQAQDLDAAQCLELAHDEERLRRLHRSLQDEVNREIVRVLQRGGRMREVAKAVQEQWQRLAVMGITTPEETDVQSLDMALEWYANTWGPVHGDWSEHIAERGFGSPRQFMAELLARYLFAHESAHDEPGETRSPLEQAS